ncbi:SRPBCC family protein [Vibrio sp. FNV 38]|nr:SRPBCC family protein [Vibrio sp. FNV 38]
MMPKQTMVHWPDYYHPRNATIHVKNQMVSENHPEIIWRCLVNAACWPGWSRSRTSVQMISGDSDSLSRGSIFLWKAGMLRFRCTVVEFEPNRRIAWKGKLGESEMYHAWLLQETPQGCNVITEATQRGGMTWFTQLYAPRGIQRYHQKWLQCLTEQTGCKKK